MEAVIARLEEVASRLEQTQARLARGDSSAVATSPVPPPPANPAPAAAPAAAAPAAAPPPPAAGGSLAAYHKLLSGAVRVALDAAEAIGGDVLRATRILADGFRGEAAVVEAMAQCQKPSDTELQQLLQPVGQQLVAAGELAGGPRSAHQNQFKLVSEAAQALSWVAYTGPNCGMRLPPQHVEDQSASAEFYANKVLAEWRAKEPKIVAWVQAIKAALQQLKEFCSKHFPAGPTWNAGGIPASQFKPGAAAPAGPAAAVAPAQPPPAAAAAAAKKGPPAPPPPPPPGSLLKERVGPVGAPAAAQGSGGNPMAALLAQISKGDAVTSQLRKVTADMKTKNRADRSGAVPAASISAPAAPGAAKAAPSAAPPRVECEQGRKWVVENQVDNREVVIQETSPKQTVYIYNCRGTTIQVKGKVNSIVLDKCSRTGLLFDNVVATVEVVNCQSVEVQCTGFVPTVAVDKCEGCHLYLSREALSADITTAKSSEVNVIIPGPSEDADPVESAIPEQFVTRYRNGQWVTEAVSHSGG